MAKKRKYSSDQLITRAYTTEFTTNEEERGVIEGLPIVFDSPTLITDYAGQYEERIDPHALDGADLSDVLLFVNHDIQKIPLARSRHGKNSTMTLSVTEQGVQMRAILDLENNSDARTLYSAIERGDMDGMSFMFRVADDDWTDLDQEIPKRRINKISIVHEVSCVNFPAYKATSVSARSDGEQSGSPLEEARARYLEETKKAEEKREIEILKLQNKNTLLMR